MNIYSNDLADGASIDPALAFGRKQAGEHMALSDNLNPQLAWSDAPAGTRSFAITCIDPDVPHVADDVNQEGRVLPESMPRVDFIHWVIVDIPVTFDSIERGSCSDGVVAGGKQSPPGPDGSRQGLNDYTAFMAGSEMAGDYFGYDGPCPPWNDERLHHYTFTVYALDKESLDLPDRFDGRDALAAMDGHVLALASLTGTYSLYPGKSG
jgi:Raf kinase inhibitor-like YbhB/YbcL family protein